MSFNYKVNENYSQLKNSNNDSNFISLEAEQSVIGGLLLKNDTLTDVSKVLSPDDFYDKRHQLLFKAIQSLASQGQPFDPITLSEQLQKDGTLNTIGGGLYVGQLASNTPSAANIMAYVRIVKEKSLKRRLANLHSNHARADDIKSVEIEIDTLLNVTKDSLTREYVTPDGLQPCDVSAFDTFVTQKPTPLNFSNSDEINFDENLMPLGIRDWVNDVCERGQFDKAAATVSALTILSSALAKRVSIYPKHFDESWRVIPNLWGALVAGPSMQKTPIINSFIYPLQKRNTELFTQYEEATAEFLKDKKNKSDDIVSEVLEVPELTQLIVNDVTPESLQEILKGKKPCVLYFRDELSGLVSGMNKNYNEGSRQFLLEGWNGNGTYSVHRISRKSSQSTNFALSIFGGIQPAVFSKNVEDAISNSANDGFLQRFQMLIKGRQPKKYVFTDRVVNADAKFRYEEIVERILNIDIEQFAVHFSLEAQPYFNDWFEMLENRIRNENNGLMAVHLGKYRSLVPSLALLFEAINNVDYCANMVRLDNVSKDSLLLAIQFSEFLEEHARSLFMNSEVKLAREFVVAQKILDKLLDKGVNEPITIRDIKRFIRGKNDIKFVDLAIGVLENFGYLFKFNVKTKGRDKTMFAQHPTCQKDNEACQTVTKGNFDVSEGYQNVSKGYQNVTKGYQNVNDISVPFSTIVENKGMVEKNGSVNRVNGNKILENVTKAPPNFEVPIEVYENINSSEVPKIHLTDKKWSNEMLKKLPYNRRKKTKIEYLHRYAKNHVAANEWLRITCTEGDNQRVGINW